MKRRIKLGSLYFASWLIVALLMVGCPANGPLVFARDAALSNKAFAEAIIISHRDGVVDDATERELLEYSKKFAQADDLAVSALQAGNKAGALVQINVALDTLDAALSKGLLGVKNQQKQVEFKAILLALRSTVVAAKAALS